MSKDGTRHSGEGNLVHSFSLSFCVFRGEEHIIHTFPLTQVAGKWPGRLSARQSQRPGELNSGVAKAVSAAPGLTWVVCSISVTGLASLSVQTQHLKYLGYFLLSTPQWKKITTQT